MNYRITPCPASASAPAVAFALAAWRELFGSRLDTAATPADLLQFEATYCQPGGQFLGAHTAHGEWVGCIGYRPYDGRFPHLGLPREGTVEVVRLFVHPAHRRAGLGTTLAQQLANHACNAGVSRLYLHTHPFLPGAGQFWLRQGYRLLTQDEDPTWRTLHLLKPAR